MRPLCLLCVHSGRVCESGHPRAGQIPETTPVDPGPQANPAGVQLVAEGSILMDQGTHFPTHPNPNLHGRPNDDLRSGPGNRANRAFTQPNPQGFHGAEHLGPYPSTLVSQSGYFDQVRYEGEPWVNRGSLSQMGMETSPVRLDQLLMGLDATPPSLSLFQDPSASSSSQVHFSHVTPNGAHTHGVSAQVPNGTNSHVPNGAYGPLGLDNNGQPYYGTPNGVSQAHSSGVPHGASQSRFSHMAPNGYERNGQALNSAPFHESLVPFGSFGPSHITPNGVSQGDSHGTLNSVSQVFSPGTPNGGSRFPTNVDQGMNMPYQGASHTFTHQGSQRYAPSQGMSFGEGFDHQSGF